MDDALIIDDNRHMADSLKQLVSLFDIPADVAYGSRAGLAVLQKKTPGVVFLDINMPGVSGFEILAYLKREPRLENVPVIVVTSDDQPETMQRAQDGGANTLIIKPVTYEALEDVLKKFEII
jgi:CheY-like chemotaxis protein